MRRSSSRRSTAAIPPPPHRHSHTATATTTTLAATVATALAPHHCPHHRRPRRRYYLVEAESALVARHMAEIALPAAAASPAGEALVEQRVVELGAGARLCQEPSPEWRPAAWIALAEAARSLGQP